MHWRRPYRTYPAQFGRKSEPPPPPPLHFTLLCVCTVYIYIYTGTVHTHIYTLSLSPCLLKQFFYRTGKYRRKKERREFTSSRKSHFHGLTFRIFAVTWRKRLIKYRLAPRDLLCSSSSNSNSSGTTRMKHPIYFIDLCPSVARATAAATAARRKPVFCRTYCNSS